MSRAQSTGFSTTVTASGLNIILTYYHIFLFLGFDEYNKCRPENKKKANFKTNFSEVKIGSCEVLFNFKVKIITQVVN